MVLTLRARGPIVSIVQASGIDPRALTIPELGRSPHTPVTAAGFRIDPPVSVPNAKGTMPLATATAEPPLDPWAVRLRSQGLRQDPNTSFSVVLPHANSWRFVFPIGIAPASRSCLTTTASRDG